MFFSVRVFPSIGRTARIYHFWLLISRKEGFLILLDINLFLGSLNELNYDAGSKKYL